MYTHPYISGLIGSERQRDMLARAEQQRLALRLRHRAGRPEPPLGRALRALARLRLPILPLTWQPARTTVRQVSRSEATPQG